MAQGEEAGIFLHHAVEQLTQAGYVDQDFEAQQARRWSALAERLGPFAPGLMSRSDYSLLANDPEAYLDQFRAALYSPLGGQWLVNLPKDPLGLLQNFLSASAVEGFTGGQDTEFRVVQIPADITGFNALAGLYPVHEDLVLDASHRKLTYHALGAPLYTSYGVASGRSEISTVGLISISALVVLLTIVLRSPMGLFVTGISVMAGVAGGFAITLVTYQQVHIIALVFSSTLIGIAADYAFHYLCHSKLVDWTPDKALAGVLRGLSLSVVSTAVAFLALTLIPFPGLQQIGLFMAAGLTCSFATVCLLFPLLYRKGAAGSLRVAQQQDDTSWLSLGPMPLVLLLIAISVPGLIQLSPRDEVRDFYAAPELLEKGREAIATALDTSNESRFLLLKAENPESLLQLEERLVAEVSGLRPGLSAIVPSEHQQAHQHQVLEEMARKGLIQRHMALLGLAEETTTAYLETIARPADPLRPDHLEGIDLPLGLGGYLGCAGETCASWLALTGREDASALARSITGNTGVSLIDTVAQVNAVVEKYRVSASYFLVAAALLVFVFLAILTDTVRAGLIMLLPVGASLLSLALLGYLHSGFSIVSVLALFIVGGMALDFGIFLQLATKSSRPATRLAIALSATSTLLAFGTLSLSATPVIAAFGISIGSGLLFAWLLSLLLATEDNEEAN
ncbi:hypothetical protein F0M18_11800 [Pseudohalioglobus sediminis]|uniref:Membrane transport protein MMPL domain-containing protein n=1 Tax=Pseudohalioglobus sediminis TaxID=2606449 RepID=A0A5B0WWH2_9GAMM|nr:hypothetical protein [Pseudohalioglobus sediminis]KAA1190491.1 hypothetical protein F0M18_11800 [Pseudohalioglobus sediminis]